MLIIISPAKTLNMTPESIQESSSLPKFLDDSEKLISILRKYKPAKLSKLMSINMKLAQLNFERYQEWALPFNSENAKVAILTFQGDVYRGINAPTLNTDDLKFAQDHLLILSGLYGILKPLDLIQAYRLEMGTKLKIGRKKNLYEFWKNKIADYVIDLSKRQESKAIINLASKEYFKAIQPGLSDCLIITPTFKEERDGEFKFIHTLGKRARGLMTRFVIQNKINQVEELKLFNLEGYYYNDNLSSSTDWVFTR